MENRKESAIDYLETLQGHYNEGLITCQFTDILRQETVLFYQETSELKKQLSQMVLTINTMTPYTPKVLEALISVYDEDSRLEDIRLGQLVENLIGGLKKHTDKDLYEIIQSFRKGK